MEKKEVIQFLESEISLLENKINDISNDFIYEWGDGLEIRYLSDAFNKFADGQISVYYSDQFNYYKEHEDECEEALFELYSPEDVGYMVKEMGLYRVACKAAICGQYNDIINELSEDMENIIKILYMQLFISIIDKINTQKIEKYDYLEEFFDHVKSLDSVDAVEFEDYFEMIEE